ncbi:sugar phosphate isomerase/epimerase family protein [Aspergillus ruber CBS 135680]|uniref:Xylose isomerase-like protein n=1 Tax=Aspergillus ruber (strain CBS 135680) TaxID=1388766 RepID=A0A017SFH6_ASPRC|nr:xylose isomerase-like protein [Aspergillus ruber CBS 135680]EYE95394.1 xylose isomerase-like protein [Aspergillus ruber CBS 135680]
MPNRLGIASMSLGRPWVHDLPSKLHQASIHGYQGIELFFDDLDCLAQTRHNGSHIEAAHQTKRLCDNLNLEIICLQPFSFYEGLLDREQHEQLVTTKLPQWFQLARILGTDLIQVPSNFLPADPTTGAPRTTGDKDVIVADLQRIADLGLQQNPPFRYVYESLAWANHIDTWEECWDVVQRVDRPNFGICLDSFNIAGRIYADPASVTGKTPNADADMQASVLRLRSNSNNIDLEKVFYVQLVDGEKLSAPLDEAHEFYVAGQPARMNWSRNARLFPFEEDRGGYLPVVDIAKAIFNDLGFKGWVSLELFSRTLANPSPGTVREHARRGRVSWDKLVDVLGLKEAYPTPVSTALYASASDSYSSGLQYRL